MFCPKCGVKQATQGRFCERCGADMVGGITTPRRQSAPLGLPAAALIGGAAAVAIGVFVSYVCLRVWVAVFLHELERASEGNLPLFQVRSFIEHIAPKLSFLNYYAYHHIAIEGSGALGRGGGSIQGNGSFVLPVLTSVLIPIIAIGWGAYLAASLRKSRDPQVATRTGITTGVIYAVLMILLRPMASLHSEQFDIPVPIGMIGSIPIPSSSTGPAFLGTVFYTLLFGIVWGWLGGREYAVGSRLFQHRPNDPKWLASFANSSFTLGGRAVAEGAIASMLLLTIVLLLAMTPDQTRRDMAREHVTVGSVLLSYAPLIPTLGGAAYCFSHGIALGGEMVVEGGPRTEHTAFEASLLGGASVSQTGLSPSSQTESLPGWIYLVLLIPAITIAVAGFRLASARQAKDPVGAAFEGAKIAGPYALFLVILGFLLGGNFSMSGGGSAGDFGVDVMRINASIGPSFFGTLFWGLVWGGVMGAAGGALSGFLKGPIAVPTRTCAKCLAKVRADSRFCQVCGQPISSVSADVNQAGMICPHCGAQEPAGTRFCSKCGKQISS